VVVDNEIKITKKRRLPSQTLKEHGGRGEWNGAEGLAFALAEDLEYRCREARVRGNARGSTGAAETWCGGEGAIAGTRARALRWRRAGVGAQLRGWRIVEEVQLGVVKREDGLGVRRRRVVNLVGVVGRDVHGNVVVVVGGLTAAGRDMSVVGEEVNVENELAKAIESDAVLGVEGKDLGEDGEALVRDGEDPAKEEGVLQEGGERLVVGRRTPPGVAATDEVDQDDTQGPDVGSAGGVGRR
jgi:hypothetical protein